MLAGWLSPMNWLKSSDASKLLEIENKLLMLYRDLAAVQQEKQITGNVYLLSNLVRMLPTKYRDEVIKIQCERQGLVEESLWDILKN